MSKTIKAAIQKSAIFIVPSPATIPRSTCISAIATPSPITKPAIKNKCVNVAPSGPERHANANFLRKDLANNAVSVLCSTREHLQNQEIERTLKRVFRH